MNDADRKSPVDEEDVHDDGKEVSAVPRMDPEGDAEPATQKNVYDDDDETNSRGDEFSVPAADLLGMRAGFEGDDEGGDEVGSVVRSERKPGHVGYKPPSVRKLNERLDWLADTTALHQDGEDENGDAARLVQISSDEQLGREMFSERGLKGRASRGRFLVDYTAPTKEEIANLVRRRRLFQKNGKAFPLSTPVGLPLITQQDYLLKKQGSVVPRLGPGITSYFHFLQFYGFLFLLFGVIAFPALFMNAYFNDSLGKSVARLSAGNLLEVNSAENEVSTRRKLVLSYNVIYDVVVVVLFLFGVEYSILLFHKAEIKFQEEKPSLDKFSIEVTGIPTGTTYEQLKAHFEKIVINMVYPKLAEEEKARLEKDQSRRTAKQQSKVYQSGRVMPVPTINDSADLEANVFTNSIGTVNTNGTVGALNELKGNFIVGSIERLQVVELSKDDLDPDETTVQLKQSSLHEMIFDDHPVYDVQLVTTTRNHLTRALEHTELVKNVNRLQAKLSAASKKLDNGQISEQRYALIEQASRKAHEKLREFAEGTESLASSRDLVTVIIKAFVTFKSVAEKNGVLEVYNKKWSRETCCEPIDPELLLREKQLRVVPAVAPGLINWEYVEIKEDSRFRRSCCSICLLIVALIISTLFLYMVTASQNIDFLSIFKSSAREITSGDVDFSLYPNIDFNDSKCTSNEVDDLLNAARTNCEEFTDLSDSETPPECVFVWTCYCTLQSAISFREAAGVDQCAGILFEQALDVAFLVGTSLIVTIFNIVLEAIITFSVKNEKDMDRSLEDKKMFRRIFAATFINTAAIKLVQSFDYKTIFDIDPGTDIQISNKISFNPIDIVFSGTQLGFDQSWYATTGYDFTFIALANLIGPHVLSFMRYFYARLHRYFIPPLTLEEAEKYYVGADLLLPIRYAQVVVTLFFTLMYSSGIPVLYFTAAFYCFITFWVDKFFLFKFYRKPTRTNNSTLLWICGIFKYAPILHMGFSVLMFSEPSLFPYDDADNVGGSLGNALGEVNGTGGEFLARITSGPVVISTITFLLLVVYQVLRQFEIIFKFMIKITHKFSAFVLKYAMLIICCCYCCCKGRQAKMGDDVFDEVNELERLLEKERKLRINPDDLDIKSYHILANDRYAKKFVLKDKMSFSTLQQRHTELHSTSDLIALLDDTAAKAVNRIVFDTGQSAKNVGKRQGSKKKSAAATRLTESKAPSGRKSKSKIIKPDGKDEI